MWMQGQSWEERCNSLVSGRFCVMKCLKLDSLLWLHKVRFNKSLSSGRLHLLSWPREGYVSHSLGRTFCYKYLTWKLSQVSLLAIFFKFIFVLFYKVCDLTFSEKAAFGGYQKYIYSISRPLLSLDFHTLWLLHLPSFHISLMTVF